MNRRANPRAAFVLGPCAALALSLVLGCTDEQEDKAKQAGEKAKQAGDKALKAGEELAEQAGEKAVEAGEKAKQAGGELVDRAGEKTHELVDSASEEAKQLWAGKLPDTGELSERAAAIIRGAGEVDSTSVEAMVARGFQIAPVALEVGKTLHSAVDGDTVIEPVIQKVDDEEAQAKLDDKIKDMPRVETIDGVSVGFKDMTQYDTGGRTTDSAYLVLWRRDDRLIGFVYRSHHRIDIDTLVRETPRLYRLIEGAL
ncbi:hypothetical protein ACNOYE_29400 [Nannocystaceae bacterium ST9]